MGKSAQKNVIASKNGVFPRFAWQSFNDGGDCFDPVRENRRIGSHNDRRLMMHRLVMLKSVLDAECPHMI
jgi:hypothetical protein